MAIITVTTGNDVVNATDGLLSLREAVARANASAGADTIVFADSVFYVQSNSSANRSALEVKAAGGALTINGDRDDDGQADVVLTNGFASHFDVAKDAALTLVGVDMINGNSQASAAANGASGVRGANSVVPTPPAVVGNPDANNDGRIDAAERVAALRYYGQDAADTGAAGRGTNGGAGEAGESRAGAIVNAGTLTLVRVGFGDNNADGGLGGTGGRGGDGGFSFRGADGIAGDIYTDPFLFTDTPSPLWLGPGHGGDGGNGGRGGDGGDGGRGGAGGDAAGAILNLAGATLSLTDVVFGGRLVSGLIEEGNSARGGNGARGGDGGWATGGGIGGKGGNDGYTQSARESGFSYRDEDGNLITFDEEVILYPGKIWSGDAGVGGNGGGGGNGGDAGANGRGGHAAGAILNLGTLTGTAAVTDANTATGGTGGTSAAVGGRAGLGAAGGLGGIEYPDAYVDPPLGSPVPPPVTTTQAQGGTRGADGLAGGNGAIGPAGRESDGILTVGTGSSTAQSAEALVYVHGLALSAVTDTIAFNVIRIGDASSTLTVGWRIVGVGTSQVTGADFAGGVLPSGTVRLGEVTGIAPGTGFDRDVPGVATAKSVARVEIDVRADFLIETPEGFRIELTTISSDDPTVTAGLGTRTATGTVVDPAGPLSGDAAANRMVGNTGNDVLSGLGGNDTMLGGAGADRLTGGKGADQLSGGAGRDIFVYRAGGDSTAAVAGRDLILDFVHGVDRIDLRSLDANAGVAGDQAFVFRGGGAFTGAGQVRVVQSDVAGTAGDRTTVYGSTDADAAPEFAISLKGLVTLTAADVLL